METTVLDPDRCYLAVSSRDRRFDGMFYTAVRTTGIYCRPSCPAITPKRPNVEFFRSAAAAQQHGYRACKRCLPDATPGSPEWDLRADLVGRAMQLIDDGVVDRDGVDGLAGRLGYSPRHLNRVLTDEVGAGPLALARAQRAQTARTLIETTDLTMTDIAYAAGFGSVRQFNDTVQAVYAASPSSLRARRPPAERTTSPSTGIDVQLIARQPFAGRQLLRFFEHRAVPGVEHVDGNMYTRSLSLPRGHGIVTARIDDDGVTARFRLADWRDLAPAVRRTRRMFDLDADPIAIDELLAGDPHLAPLVAATPGLRAAGSVDVAETIVRAIIGQQVSVLGARTVTAKLVTAVAEPLAIEHRELTHVFVSMDRLVGAPDDVFPMPRSRADTLRRVAAAVLDGRVDVDADRPTVTEQLLALKGIGPWTANYVAMRGLSDPDVMLSTDLGVKHAAAALGVDDERLTERWRPWGTYAMHHLWNTLH